MKDSPSAVRHPVPWTVTDVRVVGDHRLLVRFVDGTEGEVDITGLVFGETAGVFRVLRDPAVFARVRIEDGAVTWPGELDLAPDAMYNQIKVHGRWIVD